MADENKTDAATDAAPTTPALVWDDSKMETTFANAVNVTSTREEVSIFFGTNQTWTANDQRQISIALSDRMVLNPYAAKRLSLLLQAVLQEYEKRFGTLPLT